MVISPGVMIIKTLIKQTDKGQLYRMLDIVLGEYGARLFNHL